MRVFEPMADRIPAGVHGNARVEHFQVTPEESQFTRMRALLHPDEYVPPGKYVRLHVGGQLFMSDTPHEQRSNREVVYRAHGDVLIAGLGVGLILPPILQKPAVERVLVVEKSADVMALVEPHLRDPKLSVVCADIYDWKPPKGRKFNVIYFDIWSNMSTDDLTDMAKLHQRFKSRLISDDARRWMQSWNRDSLKEQKRRGW